MIAPYDILWNGALYPAGSEIKPHEERLIKLLTIAVEKPVETVEPVNEPAIKTKAK